MDKLSLKALRELCIPSSIIDGHQYVEIRQALPALLAIAEAARVCKDRGDLLPTEIRAALALVEE